MKLSEKGSAFIREHEGLRLKVYKDTAGLDTIGYGHLLKRGETYTEISKAKAIQLFLEDVVPAENAVNSMVKKSLLQHEFDALVSFVYNLGAGTFQKSTLLKKLNEGDFMAAANELLRWVNSGGKRTPGLVTRREKEKKLFQKGIYA